MVACTVLAALTACSSDGGGAGDGSGGAGGKATKLHAGACSTDLVLADGKRFSPFITWTWDAAGRLLSEQRTDDKATSGFDVWSQTHSWSQAGAMLTDVYKTTDKGRPDHDWTFTYGADGKPATRKGTQSGYGDESCIYEHSTEPTQPDDYSLICDYSYDTYDDDGNRTGTVKGRYGEHHTWQNLGDGLRRERIVVDDAAGGVPERELARYFDAKGRLDRIETDSSLRGYADHIVRYTYDQADRVATVATDAGGDGAVELMEARVYDDVGNLLEQRFDKGNDGSVDYRWEHAFGCW